MKDYAHLIPSAATLDPIQMQARRSLASMARCPVFIHSYYTASEAQYAANRQLWADTWAKAYGPGTNIMEPETLAIL